MNWFYPSVESVRGKRSVALMERWKEPRVDWLDLRERDNKTKQKNMSRIFKSSSTCYSHTKQQSYRRTQSPRVIRDIRRNRSHLWPWFADKFEKVFLNWPQNHHHQPKAHSFGPVITFKATTTNNATTKNKTLKIIIKTKLKWGNSSQTESKKKQNKQLLVAALVANSDVIHLTFHMVYF